MRSKSRADRPCAYVVPIAKTVTPADDLREFSEYLSTLGVIGCEVIVLDASPPALFEENDRVLRWVSRHIPVDRPFDVVRISATITVAERIIVAGEDVRYSEADIGDVRNLLDFHEVVEPQDYLHPLSWWGGIDMARLLVHRGVDRLPDHAPTFAFRRSVLRSLRGFDATAAGDPARRMAMFGAEVYSALDIFVRREPQPFREWLRSRPLKAAAELAATGKSTMFFALIPALLMLALFAGASAALGAAAALSVGSIVLAARGRAGATAFFPLRACLYAPLWLAERSVSVYWAVVWKLQQAAEPVRGTVAEKRARAKAASGE